MNEVHWLPPWKGILKAWACLFVHYNYREDGRSSFMAVLAVSILPAAAKFFITTTETTTTTRGSGGAFQDDHLLFSRKKIMFVIVVIAVWVIVSKVLWYYYDDFECFVHRASRRTSATTVNSVFMHSAAGCELPWYNISLHTHWFLVAHHLSDEAWEVMTNNNLFCACQMIAAVEEFSRFFLWAVAMYFVYQQRSHTMTTMLKLSFNFYGDNNSMYVVVLLQSSR